MSARLSSKARNNLQRQLLGWFREHRRDLPWRRSRDPYRIWVAEVMLQQTRIATVIPYYDRFLDRFPRVEDLARASESEALKFWSGLGYYSRARNLHRSAKQIVERHGGAFPRDLDAALALPGIGPYTVAAILSITYDAPLAVLDGNVARVLARLGAIRGDLRAPRRWKELQEMAQTLLATESPGDWNQALMELGEVICTPQTPRCNACPVRRSCRAHSLGIIGAIPQPRKKRGPVAIKIAAAVLRDPRGRTMLVKNPGAHDEVLFSRMWQFPATEVKRNAKSELAAYLRTKLDIACDGIEALPEARHCVTYRNITLLPYLVRVPAFPKLHRAKILRLAEVGRLPVSSATRKIVDAALTGQREILRTRKRSSE
ncbi:MAG: A/G-specific adenine glycosylase [Candidatus Acidiferrales bacterium]